MNTTSSLAFMLRRWNTRYLTQAHAKFICFVAGALAVVLAFAPDGSAYTFDHFGGRKGRAGVTDSLYMWNIGATGGQLTWWLNRDQLTLGQADATQFTALQNRIQPELTKWSNWLDVGFAEAANQASANVVIEFRTTFNGTGQAVPNNGGTGAAAQYNSVTGTTLNTAEISLYPSNNWATDMNDFSYVILHEWGHVLGLGDEYLNAPLAGEDFIDHGFPSGPSPNTNGKGDNVMNTRGVMTLDNDDIAAAQWTMGGLGNDSLVTGSLNARGANDNAAGVAAHHGPGTWQYRGTSSVAADGGGTVVTLNAYGATAARSLGPGVWTSQIFPDKVVFTSDPGYAGNFIFELDSPNPEGYITARIADNTPTDFTALPLANGPQLFPNPMVFGPVPEPAALILLLAAVVAGLTTTRRTRNV
jgi:hypothetical protein